MAKAAREETNPEPDASSDVAAVREIEIEPKPYFVASGQEGRSWSPVLSLTADGCRLGSRWRPGHHSPTTLVCPDMLV
jgi:hypothetical protein